ncbi:MAG: hypothetical protein MJA30_17525, partial [Cytophagales bacterium]|nr:hypothetical protein [Cytophagales bacterium]
MDLALWFLQSFRWPGTRPWSAAKMLAYFARFNYLMVRSLTIRGAVGYYHQKQKNFPYRHSGRW